METAERTFRSPFAAGRPRPLFIGMVHLLALPGSPRYQSSLNTVLKTAESDLRALIDGGADGALVENFGDTPFYPDQVPPATVAAMTAAAIHLKASCPPSFLLGVNVLRNDATAALAVAVASGARFIRVNVHVGVAIADQGFLVGRAHETLRLRRQLGTGIAILADVGVKHAASLGRRPVEEDAREAWERGLADGILLTGPRTGAPVDLHALERVRKTVPEAPLLVASGVDPSNALSLAPLCDGFIVGTWLKRDGVVANRIDPARVVQFRASLTSLRPLNG